METDLHADINDMWTANVGTHEMKFPQHLSYKSSNMIKKKQMRQKSFPIVNHSAIVSEVGILIGEFKFIISFNSSLRIHSFLILH